MPVTLKLYHQKRDFKKTAEPKGKVSRSKSKNLFIIQKHAASHLHYDFRLELNGVLLSWAVPKGPCLDPTVKRLAMHVEDHPVEYGSFEGIIPKGEYGGGTVMLWDKGKWFPESDDPARAYKEGHLKFYLDAKKLKGLWKLIRINRNDKTWLLMKGDDEFAKPLKKYDITIKEPNSVLTQQSIDEITKNHTKVWGKHGAKRVKSPTAKGPKKTLNKSIKKSSVAKSSKNKLRINQTKSTKKSISAGKKAIKKKPRISKLNLNLQLPTSSFPKILHPQLATLVDQPPIGENWLHEIKFDGYRLLIYKKGSQVTIMTRNNNDWTDKFPTVAEAVANLPIDNIIIDGEVVILDEDQHSNFQLLQNSIKAGSDQFIFYMFDLLYYHQFNLINLPLLDRKKILKDFSQHINNDILRYSDHIIGQGYDVFGKACELGLEGIISKEIDSVYSQARDKTWLKIKCNKRQEFIIGGFLKSARRQHFRSLMLGTFNKKGELIYNGNVGTGFTHASLKEIYMQMAKHESSKMPFKQKPPGSTQATWLHPVLVAEIEFTEWTDAGTLRHPSFKGLRKDKPANTIKKEIETPVEKATPSASRKKPMTQLTYKLTHPEKILYAEDHITKQDLANYYEQVQEWILPYLNDRPLTLVRCPNHYQQCFYQKHLGHKAPGLHEIMIKEKEGKAKYIYLNEVQGLLSLVQMSILEIHTWGSEIHHLEEPDMLVFDLDPAPDVTWKRVVAAAKELKSHFDAVKLKSFVKTTGGKGLHVVVPIQPEYDWLDIKNFSHALVDYLVMEHPKEYIGKMTKADRKNKIFIDYLRNQRGATAIAPYSTRARAHAPIATPLHWDELTNNIKDTFFTLKTLPKRLDQLKRDPWKDFFKIKQSLDVLEE